MREWDDTLHVSRVPAWFEFGLWIALLGAAAAGWLVYVLR